MPSAPLSATVQFYETHPINGQQILKTLENEGIALAGLDESVLKDYDQDHFGGTEAVDTLAQKAGIQAHHHVLDVCSGMGGPARYLAHYYGCRVTGLDITEGRYHGACRLTQLVGLQDRVGFQLGDATAMPFDNAQFDIVIGQEAWAHVPDKPRLIGECARVIKPGGVIAFTDILKTDALTGSQQQRLQQEMTFNDPASAGDYRRLLQETGFVLLEHDDLSAFWAEILVQRLTMYRSLRAKTIASFGEAHFKRWDTAYAFFVGLFSSGELAGGRFIARRMPA
jgi:ubiquinone/menaquinone biosynthesis C-methylase UbiE